jgi:hypothetical protein
MSFANPVQNLALPYAIQKRLNEMFAGSTGFSGPEMVEYFSRHDVNIEPYSWRGGMPGRKQIFEDCHAHFPFERQLEIIADLLTIDHLESIHHRRKEIVNSFETGCLLKAYLLCNRHNVLRRHHPN